MTVLAMMQEKRIFAGDITTGTKEVDTGLEEKFTTIEKAIDDYPPSISWQKPLKNVHQNSRLQYKTGLCA